MRAFLALFTIVVAFIASPLGHRPTTHAQESRTFVSGASISQPIRLAPVDEDAFVRRINVPPKLDNAPEVSGPTYALRSPYWAQVLPGREGVRPAADETATYYRDSGYVKARQGNEDSWLALDLRQRAIIERYLRLGENGLISREPGILEVLRADAVSGSAVAVAVDKMTLSDAQAAALWDALSRNSKPLFLDPRRQPQDTQTWLTFTLPEGRSVTVSYSGSPGRLIDFLGSEEYAVSPPLGQAIAAVAGLPLAVPQEPGTGSKVWWLVMIGGGAVLLALAVYMRRDENSLS